MLKINTISNSISLPEWDHRAGLAENGLKLILRDAIRNVTNYIKIHKMTMAQLVNIKTRNTRLKFNLPNTDAIVEWDFKTSRLERDKDEECYSAWIERLWERSIETTPKIDKKKWQETTTLPDVCIDSVNNYHLYTMHKDFFDFHEIFY